MKALRANVWWLGLTSLLTDLSTEMLAPIMPFFLRMIGAGTIGIGLIEGLAHATERVLSIFSGWASDKFRMRKPIIIFGYALSTVMKAVYAFVIDWPAMILPRFFERGGKAIRNPPRDALLAESVGAKGRRAAFALHRVLDTIGALVGPFVSFALVAFALGAITESTARTIFFIAVIPGATAVVLLAVFVREPPRLKTTGTALKDIFKIERYGKPFLAFLIASVLFYLAWPQQAFFYLKLNEVGFAVEHVLLLAAVFQAAYIAGAALLTKISLNLKRAITLEFALLGIVFLGLALTGDPSLALALFAAYGVLVGAFEVDSKVYISHTTSKQFLASAFGVQRTLSGFAIVVSGVLIGALWALSSALAFLFAGALVLATAFYFWKK